MSLVQQNTWQKKTKKLVEEKGVLCTPNIKLGKLLKSDTRDAVVKYFYRQDVSKEMAGKSNVVSVKENRKRVLKRKRLVLGHLSELYAEFCDKNPERKISMPKFAQLRPKECVLASSTGTHNVCVCTYHENPTLMFDGARLKKLLGVKYVTDCLKMLVCSEPSQDCYLRICKNCPGTFDLMEKMQVAFDKEMIESVMFNQWETADRANIITRSLSIEEFTTEFLASLEDLVTHHFIYKCQAKFYEYLKKKLKPGEVIVNADFPENFTFIVQNSIQSYYFSNAQATIHLFSCYYIDPVTSKLKQVSLAVISDHMDHSTTAVHAFQRKLLNTLKEILPEVKKIFYFSDGSYAQYKNKNTANVWFHDADFGMGAEWHFYATCHGKCACDGIGGTIKRLVTLFCLKHFEPDSQITTPYKLFQWAQSNLPGIKCMWVSDEDVCKAAKDLQLRFETVLQIDGLKSSHAIIPLPDENAVLIKRFSEASAGEKRVISTRERDLNFSNVRGFVTFWDKVSPEWHLALVAATIEEDQSFMIQILSKSDTKKFCFVFEKQDLYTAPLDCILTVTQPNFSSKGQVITVLAAEAKAADITLKHKLDVQCNVF